MTRFPQLFSERDDMFFPPESTFELTRRPETVNNVNTIPGHDELYTDIGLIPNHNPCAVMERVREIATKHQERSGATITVPWQRVRFPAGSRLETPKVQGAVRGQWNTSPATSQPSWALGEERANLFGMKAWTPTSSSAGKGPCTSPTNT